jgi:hypothetical protein
VCQGDASEVGSGNSLVARLDQESDVGVHEWHGHGDVGSVWQDSALVRSLLLDAKGGVSIGGANVKP